ncbi:MAG TPA: hypothetical protein ENJ37_05955 [Deltaproteobacteria bacterium]|nr:hypothetical protein [Deltaproteobacteria bacterium]
MGVSGGTLLARRAAALAAAAIMLGAAGAARAGVEVRAEVDRTDAAVVERFIYTLHVTVDDDTAAVLPVDRPDFTPLDMLGMAGVDKREEGGRTYYRLDYVLVSYEPGELTIPAQPVYYSEDGGPEQVAWSRPIRVVVRRTVPETVIEIEDIRDPQPERAAARPWPAWAYAAAAAAALAGAAVTGYMLTRGREETEVEAGPSVDPREAALRALDEIEGAGIGDPRTFYRAVCSVVEGLVLSGVELPPSGVTTSAFLRLVASLERGDEEGRRRLAEFRFDSDLVVFGGYRPAGDEPGVFVERARELVGRDW